MQVLDTFRNVTILQLVTSHPDSPAELDVENWVETVEKYGSLYHRVEGKVENLKRKAMELGQRWVSGQGKSRWVFLRKRKAKGGQPAAAVTV